MIDELKFDSFSELVPPINIPIEVSNLGEELVKKLEIIIEVEEPIIMKTVESFVKDPPTNYEDWVSDRGLRYNLLKYADRYSELNELKQKIYSKYISYVTALNLKPTNAYIQVWINVLRKDSRYFTKHHHAHPARIGDPNDTYISGNICIRAENTKTYYYSPYIDTHKIGMDNTAGDIVLFPGWLTHSTDQNKSELPRLSIAFDIITEETYNKGAMAFQDNYILLND